MDQTVLKKNIGKLVGQRNSFLLFSILLAIAVILLSSLLLARKDRVVIVPTQGETYWIEERQASGGYLEKMGIFLSDLLLNRTPADVDRRNKIILEHVHPSFYHECKKRLNEEKEALLKGEQSLYFKTETNRVLPVESSYLIEGEMIVFVGKEGKEPYCSQKSKKRYVLRFQCEHGRLLLTSMKKEEV